MTIISKLRKIIARNRIISYGFAFVLLLILSAVISVKSVLLPIDLYVYKILHFNSDYVKGFDESILFINVNDKQNNRNLSKGELKLKTADLLNMIDSMVIYQKYQYEYNNEKYELPLIVVDASFDSNPAGHKELKNAIDSLYNNDIMVYGVYDMPGEGNQNQYEIHDQSQAQELYKNYLEGGRLHTDIIEDDKCVLSYYSYLTIPKQNGSMAIIPALPVQVANDFRRKDPINYTEKGPTNHVLPFRVLESLKDHTYLYNGDGSLSENNAYSPFKRSIDVQKKIIIIGFFERDETQTICDFYEIPGSHLLGWAIWDQLNDNKLAKQPFDNQLTQWGIILFCAFFVTIIFVLLFKFQRKLHTRPYLIAGISFISGVIILFLIGLAFYSLGNGGEIIRPSLPVLGMFLSSALAWRYHGVLIDLGIVEGGEKYDIFISYSGAQRAWVRKEVYEPLIKLHKIEKPKENLKVFFDQEEIEEGTPFVHKYKNGIVNSTMFVPIFTKEYFDSPYCKKEMSYADGRAETDLIYIYPFTFDLKIVPEVYLDKNIIELDENSNSDFISKLKKRLDIIQQQKLGLSQPEGEDEQEEVIIEPPVPSEPNKEDSEIRDPVEEVVPDESSQDLNPVEAEIQTDESTQEIKPVEDEKKDKKEKRKKKKEKTTKKQKKGSNSKKPLKKKKKQKKVEKTLGKKKKLKDPKEKKRKSKKRSNKKEKKKSKLKKLKKYSKKAKGKKGKKNNQKSKYKIVKKKTKKQKKAKKPIKKQKKSKKKGKKK